MLNYALTLSVAVATVSVNILTLRVAIATLRGNTFKLNDVSVKTLQLQPLVLIC